MFKPNFDGCQTARVGHIGQWVEKEKKNKNKEGEGEEGMTEAYDLPSF